EPVGEQPAHAGTDRHPDEPDRPDPGLLRIGEHPLGTQSGHDERDQPDVHRIQRPAHTGGTEQLAVRAGEREPVETLGASEAGGRTSGSHQPSIRGGWEGTAPNSSPACHARGPRGTAPLLGCCARSRRRYSLGRMALDCDDDPMTPSPEEITTLAARHGLELEPARVHLNESGLDYLVAHARDATGANWVLRFPRRADLATGARVEAMLLDLVRDRVST